MLILQTGGLHAQLTKLVREVHDRYLERKAREDVLESEAGPSKGGSRLDRTASEADLTEEKGDPLALQIVHSHMPSIVTFML